MVATPCRPGEVVLQCRASLNLHFFHHEDGSTVDPQEVIQSLQEFVAGNIGLTNDVAGADAFPPLFIPIWQDKFASAMLGSLWADVGKHGVAKLLRAYVREHRPVAAVTVLESWAARDQEKVDTSRSLEGQPGVYEVVCLCYESLYEQKVWLAEITGTGSSRILGQ